MYLLGYEDKPEIPDSLILIDYEQSKPALMAFCNLSLPIIMICDDPRNRISVASLDDVPSLVAHFVYNIRLQFELMTVNSPSEVFSDVKPMIQQALTSAEVCAYKLRLLQGPDCDINRAWATLKQHALSVLSNKFVGNQERAALYVQIEEVCGRFGTALSERVSGRLRQLLSFGQNIKAVIGITDNMIMLEVQAAEIYMRTTNELLHDSFTSEFMGVTEAVRGYMRQVIADPHQNTSEEMIESVHTLAVWQAEHFLSHFNPEAFDVSDVLGVLKSDGLAPVPEDLLERYSEFGHHLPCQRRRCSDASESSSGEEKTDVSEKQLVQASSGGYEEINDDKLTDDQQDLTQVNVQPLQIGVGHETDMAQARDDYREAVSCTESSTTVASFSAVTNQQSVGQPHQDHNNTTADDMSNRCKVGLLEGHHDRVAIVRPNVRCDGVVNGWSLEEWKELVASVNIVNKGLTSDVQHKLSTAIHDQVTVVTHLQEDITQLKEAIPFQSSGIVLETLDKECREKQRKLVVAETWIQQLNSLQQTVEEMLRKSKLKTIAGLDSLIVKDAIKQILEEHSGGNLDFIRRLASAVSQLIQQIDISI
jgi:hypothetical protein